MVLTVTMSQVKKKLLSTNHRNISKCHAKVLLRSLRLQLNSKLKKTKEQRFILSRLKIFDEQFCLQQIHSLYRTYFDLGSKHQMWPVSLSNAFSK